MVRAPLQTSRTIQTKLVILETELKDKLKPFFLKMSRFGLPAETFQINTKLQFSIYGIIRKKVQDGYLIGLESVGELIQKRIDNFELFISVNDTNLIAEKSKEMINQFWVTITNLLNRERQVRQQNITLSTKEKFNPDAALIKFASFVIYSGYNTAIDSKLKNILPGQRQGSSTR